MAKNIKKKITLVFLIVVMVVVRQHTDHVHAENGKSVLKSAEIKSRGRIQGQEGCYYDGSDMKKLADDMAVLYKSCQ